MIRNKFVLRRSICGPVVYKLAFLMSRSIICGPEVLKQVAVSERDISKQ